MSFCEAIQAAIDTAPDDDTKVALQAIYDSSCGGGAHTDGGGPHTPPDGNPGHS